MRRKCLRARSICNSIIPKENIFSIAIINKLIILCEIFQDAERDKRDAGQSPYRGRITPNHSSMPIFQIMQLITIQNDGWRPKLRILLKKYLSLNWLLTLSYWFTSLTADHVNHKRCMLEHREMSKTKKWTTKCRKASHRDNIN